LMVKSLVKTSYNQQIGLTADIFTNSIRADILNGLDQEVYRKCQSLLTNQLVAEVHVYGLGARGVCTPSTGEKPSASAVKRKIKFSPESSSVAGRVEISFKSDLGYSLIQRFSLLIIFSIVLLLIGYWLVGIYLVRKETVAFSELSTILRNSDISEIENCSSIFKEDYSKEFGQLCDGVEKLSKNWRTLQAELIKNARLEAINESSKLLAHDIKSPLGGIKTASTMFDSKPEGSKLLLAKCVLTIEKMIQKITDNSSDEAPTSNKELIRLTDFFSTFAIDYNTMVSEEVDFSRRIQPIDEDLIVVIDPDLVRRSLENLGKNAIEAYKESGGQKAFKLSMVLEIASTNFSFIVSDNGPGIPQKLIEKIGRKKLQSRKLGGSGLGLLQVNRTMLAHDGKLKIDSRSGVGTTIKLIFPRNSPS